MEEYSRGEIAKEVGIKGETINLWTVMGLIQPNASLYAERSHRRKYDKYNVLECHFIKFFQQEGFSLDKIKRILDQIRNYNDLAKRKDMPNFYDDPDLDGWYRYIKYKSVRESSAHTLLTPIFFEDFMPDPEKKGFMFFKDSIVLSLEELVQDAFYFEAIDLGSVKRKIFKNLNI